MSPAQRRRAGANGSLPRKRRMQRHGSSSLTTAGDDSDINGVEIDRPRRAPIACRACRARKVKCDNHRPTCAGCVRLRCECVYPEPVRYGLDLNIPTEQGNVQLGNILQEILQRLPPEPEPSQDHEITSHHRPRNGSTEEIDHSFTSATLKRSRSPTSSNFFVGISPDFTSLEHVFQWSIFRTAEAGDFKGAVLAADYLATQSQAPSGISVPVLEGDEITELLKAFLQLVHVMNPVMDSTALLSDGREVAELGPQWDAKTCLVFLAAALGVLAKPFNPMPDTPESLSTSASREDVQAYRRAESYYAYARRRFGLLDRSLTACHCHFLSGIYLMYTFRPVQAWQSFNEASNLYTVYLKSRAAAQVGGHNHDPDDGYKCRLEQCMYWSCVKSENEICSEVELPSSSLHNIECSYQFPSPPMDRSPIPASTPSLRATIEAPSGPFEAQECETMRQHSWFYYLSEISLFRLSSRLNYTFYNEHPTSWTSMNLLDMMNAAWDFEKQLQRWQEVLPRAISCFDMPDLAMVTELQLATWSRWASIKLRLYRPFLYRFLNQQEQDWVLNDSLRNLAQKAVLMSLDPLFTLGLRHRHAGAWYKCRESAVRALIILCARRIGLTESMGVKGRAETMLRICIGHLSYWEREAEDLRVARELIEKIKSSGEFS